MNKIVYCARRLIQSNLGWFHKTRETIGEAAGRERAININRDVFNEWFPELDQVHDQPIEITTRYFASHGDNLLRDIQIDRRTIRRQGGGKNWRLAGLAVRGDYYDMREGDIMLMVFNRETFTLSWTVCRGNQDKVRKVSAAEISAWLKISAILGRDHRNMWQFTAATMARIVEQLNALQPLLGELFFDNSLNDDDIVISDRELKQLAEIGFDLDIDLVLRSKKRVARMVAERQGQANFRQTLLIAYNGVCAMTGSSVQPALEAAHIIPYFGRDSNSPRNGMMLRADAHTLFDLGLITVNHANFQTCVHECLLKSEYGKLQGQVINLPSEESLYPSSAALLNHNRHVFQDASKFFGE